MACGGCGHKYFRPPRTSSVGGAAKPGVQRVVSRWKQRIAPPVVQNPKEQLPISDKPKEG